MIICVPNIKLSTINDHCGKKDKSFINSKSSLEILHLITFTDDWQFKRLFTEIMLEKWSSLLRVLWKGPE